jgi:hypothetical protein
MNEMTMIFFFFFLKKQRSAIEGASEEGLAEAAETVRGLNLDG